MKIMRVLCSCFVLALSFSACTKMEDEAPDTFPYYFTATINSQPVKYEANFTSRFGCGSTSRLHIGDTYEVYEGTVIKDNDSVGKNQIQVYLLKHFPPGEQPTAEQLLAMFQVGSYAYGALYGNDGAIINYTDENGVKWSSETGSQAGSSFVLTGIRDDEYRVQTKRINAEFSCRLYTDDGRSLELKDGKISGCVLSQ